jgi:hypothetical protein
MAVAVGVRCLPGPAVEGASEMGVIRVLQPLGNLTDGGIGISQHGQGGVEMNLV